MLQNGSLMRKKKNQYIHARDSLNEAAQIVAKYEVMRLEDITEGDKIKIRETSRKMDDALATMDQLTETMGYQVLDSSQKHVVNRRKLNNMMGQLNITR